MVASRDSSYLLAWKTCCFYYLTPNEPRNKISVPIDTGVLTRDVLQHPFSNSLPARLDSKPITCHEYHGNKRSGRVVLRFEVEEEALAPLFYES